MYYLALLVFQFIWIGPVRNFLRDIMRSNQSILKEISPGISLGRMMLKLKLQYFGHLMRRVDLLEDSDAGRDWGQEEKGMTEDKMAGWHHWLDGLKSEWTLGDGDGQGGLACCDSWGHKELDTAERLNWTELNHQGSRIFFFISSVFLTSAVQWSSMWWWGCSGSVLFNTIATNHMCLESTWNVAKN